MATVLFLAPADLGETVLASGALAAALSDERDLVSLCVPDEARPLFRAVPGLRVFTPWKRAGRFVFFALLRGVRYDTVIDARGGWPGRIMPARHRIRLDDAKVLRHRVEEWSEAAGSTKPLAPVITLDDQARADAARFASDTAPVLVIAPGGVTADKRWPRERFAAVARRLAGGPISGAQVVVLGAGARDAETTRAIVSSLHADGITARGEALDLLAAAALMERATLCIGNDNALTHIAAAMGAPTLTLFGPTDERVRAPYGPRARTLRGRSLEEIAALPALDVGAAMEDVSIDAVEAAATDLLHAGGLR
jgi:ADP-heptose:LPS heptosyltransferase